MLISALQAVKGESNPLGLRSKRSICVILIDGLGTHNLAKAAGHARFLNSQQSKPASCWFPATTSASITSFATGKHPSDIGFIGYQVFDRVSQQAVNLLSGWNSFAEGATYQDESTIAEQAIDSGIAFHAVAPTSYETSGFTGATMRGAIYRGKNDIGDRFASAKRLLAEPDTKVIYLYIPELDQIAHAYGSESTEWLNQLEDVDSLVASFVSSLPKHAGVILTADHGVIDVKKDAHIFLDDLLPLADVDFVGGDTRAPFIYLKQSSELERFRTTLKESLAGVAYVTSPQELVESGYWVQNEKWGRISPDLVLVARKEVAFYHRGFAKKKSLEMIGHHGAMTTQEMSIPLLTFGF